jgi:hypothetical protein
MSLHSLWQEEGRNLVVGEATTDGQGRYTLSARPGTIQISPIRVPNSHLGPDYNEYPKLVVKADQTLPEIKLTPASALDGVVLDGEGQPVVGAEVLKVVPEPAGVPWRDAPIHTGSGGAFHVEQLDPDDKLSVRARSKGATTDGAVIIRPNEVKGKLTLTSDS